MNEFFPSTGLLLIKLFRYSTGWWFARFELESRLELAKNCNRPPRFKNRACLNAKVFHICACVIGTDSHSILKFQVLFILYAVDDWYMFVDLSIKHHSVLVWYHHCV